MKKKKLKLYVWEGVLEDYTSGMACALATSPAHARKILRKKGINPDNTDIDDNEPLVVSRPAGFYVYGGG